jgi:hypothetical protein
MTLDCYSHWIPSMGRHAAEDMDEALEYSLLLTYCRQSPRHLLGGILFYGICRQKRRADERTRTADLISLRVIIQALQGFARGANPANLSGFYSPDC